MSSPDKEYNTRSRGHAPDGAELIDTREEPYVDNPNADYEKQVSAEGPKNTGNVIGGYKATLSNPKVSQEAKEHAKEVLQKDYNVDV